MDINKCSKYGFQQMLLFRLSNGNVRIHSLKGKFTNPWKGEQDIFDEILYSII